MGVTRDDRKRASNSREEIGYEMVEIQETARSSATELCQAPEPAKKHRTIISAFKESPRLCACGIALAAVTLLFGYETVFLGSVAVLPAFKETFGVLHNDEYIIPAAWISAWAASGPVGSLVGALIGGWSQDAIGRYRTIAVAGVLQAGTVAISYLADQAASPEGRRGLYFAGKSAQGVAMGAMLATAQAYMSEVLPPHLRGPVLSLHAPFTLVGQFVGSILIRAGVDLPGQASYRIPIACQWLFSAIPLAITIFLPESPVWLIRKGRLEEARTACQMLEGKNIAESSDNSFDRLRAYAEQEKVEVNDREELSYLDLFRRPANRRRTLIIVFAALIPELFGLPMLGHASYFLEILGMNERRASTAFIAGVVIGMIANFAAFWVVSKVGRRTLVVFSLGIIAVIWGSIGVTGCFKSAAGIWYTAVGMILIIFAAGIGCWPASHAIMGETSTLSLRGRASGFGWFCSSSGTVFFAACTPYLYNPDAANIGGRIGFLYFGLAGVGSFITWLCVPEMKDRTPVEVDRMFESGLSARQFHAFKADD